MNKSSDPIRSIFGSHEIGDGQPVFIIAEIGVNHEGSSETCRSLIEGAARAGADAVKLQSSDADEHYVPGSESHDLYSKAGLTHEQTAEMFSLAMDLGLEVFTTCGDLPTIDFLETLDPPGYKISSGMLGHLPIIRRLAETGRPLIISTGFSEMPAIDIAVDAARKAGATEVSLLHCVSVYPADMETLNLRSITTLRQRYGVPVGFSDHSLGCEAAVLAVATGACIVEKHLSFDRNRPGFDHHFSLEPDGFQELVQAVRRAERILGTGDKRLSPAEAEMADRFSRQLVARCGIAGGEILSADNVSIMRTKPNSPGLPGSEYDDVMGRVVVQALNRFEPIVEENLK